MSTPKSLDDPAFYDGTPTDAAHALGVALNEVRLCCAKTLHKVADAEGARDLLKIQLARRDAEIERLRAALLACRDRIDSDICSGHGKHADECELATALIEAKR